MKQIIFIIALFAFNFCSVAQSIEQYPMSENALLWKIEGPGVKSKSYIFGTIHIIDKDKFYYPKKLEKIIGHSDQVVLEIADLDPAKAMQYILLKQGSFFDYFTEPQIDSILYWAETEAGMDEVKFRFTMSKLKPFAVVQLATQMSIKVPTESYELTIESQAKGDKTPVLGLETIEDQIGIFDNMDSTSQAKMVMESIRDYAESDSLTAKMQSIYLKQNVDLMYQLITESEGSIQDMTTELLDDRNTKWIPLISAFIQNKNTFIAVGAGHLGGPNGVLRLLEKAGYTLIPIQL